MASRVINALGRLLRRAKGYVLFGKRVEIFGPFTVLVPGGVRLGRNVAINHGVFLNGGCRIEIGNDAVLSARCMIIDVGLDPATFGETIAYRNAPIRIGSRAWIGASAIILPGVTIGDGAIIGAGSVVTRDVPAGQTWAGNPARALPTRS